ncbi:MAG: diacylglycerol kinase [Woeseia sp.]
MKPGHTGVRRIVHAARFSALGFRQAWQNEAAFRQELVATLLLTPVALWLGRSNMERALLIGVCLFVMLVELLNSAVEVVVDRIGPEHHELSGRAKDYGSSAVFLGLAIFGLVWGVVIYERFIA